MSVRHFLNTLVKHGKLSCDDARRAELWNTSELHELIERLIRAQMVTESSLAQVRAHEMGVPLYETLPKLDALPASLSNLPAPFMRSRRLIPIEESGDLIKAASDRLDNLDRISELEFMLSRRVQLVYAPSAEIDSLLAQLLRPGKPAIEKKEQSPKAEIFEQTDESPVAALLTSYISRAIEEGASDIHFEPKEEGLSVRFRIDGALVTRPFDYAGVRDQLLTRIRVLAGLDIAEHRLAQDGRIQFPIGARLVDLRVSVIPTANGQRIVLRILDKSKMLLDTTSLSMPGPLLASFKRLINKSEGIVLVTGPTGSGKTTSLYCALSEVNVESINIMTIEDPIEYRLEGISQMAVRPEIGMTFAEGLRHLLRQDPDVLMVGEIRDSETAKVAIQAALTGHLVLSTLHTNDAPSAVTRLVEMGVESYLLSSSLVGVLAQRLVRTICPKCRESYAPSTSELNDLGIQAEILWHGTGCSACFGTGYSGRRAIFELLEITPALRGLISSTSDADKLALFAREQGMQTLLQSGAALVLSGGTTSKEIMRVVG